MARESGTVYKEHGGRVKVCLVYPNLYSLGMANLGFQTTYRLFNDLDFCVAERCFLPGKAETEEHGRTSTPLLSYETQTPVRDFDIVAFSVPFENDYVNIPALLTLAGLPVFASERCERANSPLVMAGGVAVSLNPEPISEIMDLFMIGEGEGAVAPMAETFYELKERGGATGEEILRELDTLAFTYIPSFYGFSYEGPGIKGINPVKGAKSMVRAAKSFALDGFQLPESFITTPDTEFRDTFLAEIERGCGRGCRFCAAGFLYMPPRWRSVEAVMESMRKGVEKSGKVGLVGAAVSEYPEIKSVVEYGVELGGTVTLSSLRLDTLDHDFLALLKKAGYKTVTMAPEAGSPRLRAVINKGLTDEDIIAAVKDVYETGFTRLKLYFLVGLPTETSEDIEALVDLSVRIRAVMKKGSLTISVNPFIPKPFTPFQWHGYCRSEVVEQRLGVIKKVLSGERGVTVKATSAREAYYQAYIARADRRAGSVIMDAAGAGLKKAVKKAGHLVEKIVYRDIGKDEILPWDLIDHGLEKDYLWKEYQRGLTEKLTPPCDVGRCARCGICSSEFLGR